MPSWRAVCNADGCHAAPSVNIAGGIFSPSPGCRFQLCVPAKCGVEAWSELLRVHQRRNAGMIVSGYCGHGCRNSTEATAFALTPRLRLLIVRNPYERLLSGFLDQVGRLTEQSEHMLGLTVGFLADPKMRKKSCLVRPASETHICRLKWNTSKESFQQFVRELVVATSNGRNAGYGFSNDHLLPIMHRRVQDSGVRRCLTPRFRDNKTRLDQYYQVLKVEEMAAWYPRLVSMLGLTNTVRRGWPGNGCWWKAPGLSCTETLTGNHPEAVHSATTCATGAEGGMDPRKVGHATQACSKLRRYYTPELAELVSEWARADLDAFGYPPWRPSPKTPWPLSSSYLQSQRHRPPNEAGPHLACHH